MTKIWEAIKDPLRLLVLAIIPFGLDYLGVINTQWAIIATLVLKAIDKYLHRVGEENGDDVLSKGLTRF
jgi:hypothetical protein